MGVTEITYVPRGAAGGVATATPGALGRDIAGLPLPVWGAIASCLAMIVGWNWDISWHRSVGRDTVWTLAHIAIYVALFLAFLYNAALVLSHTFGSLRGAPGVRVLGFQGPSASFLTLWGLLLQFAAIVFDDWWHNVYGLDVDVFSPPHGLLAWGIAIFYMGQFAVVAVWHNTIPEARRGKSAAVAILLWSMYLGHMAIAADAYYGPMAVRSVDFIASSALTFPFGLVFIGAFLGRRHAAFWTALLYVGTAIVLMQVFQLFPSTPQFGPVYHRAPNFLPPTFPMMLLVPALALALVVPGSRSRPSFGRCVLAGLVFVLSFNATNYYFAGFLRSPAAANRFFGGIYPGSVFEETFRKITEVGWNLRSYLSILAACVIAPAIVWLGDRGGRWLRGVVR